VQRVPFGLAAPPHVLGNVFQSDFRAPLEVGGKSRISQTGVFQHNLPQTVSSSSFRFRRGSEWRQCGLRLQQTRTMSSDRSGPIASVTTPLDSQLFNGGYRGILQFPSHASF
jgi:hypothetical protein